MELDHGLLMQTFSAEAEEQLAAMEEGLVGIELHPGDSALLASVFRAAHTLKGNAGTVGLGSIARRADVIEDALDLMRTGALVANASLVSALLAALDVLRKELYAAVGGDESQLPEHDEVFASVTRLLERLAGDAPRDPAALVAEATLAAQFEPVREQRGSTLRIDAAKLDRMLSLSGELSIARGRLRTHLVSGGPDALRQALESHVEAERLYRDLQEEIMRARLVPLGPIFRQYQRVVRDVSLEHGKRAELHVAGEDVEIDTSVAEHVRGPLMHMLRNALDHGIETPERRAQLGKEAVGRITLSARREASHIVLELADDGAGFSRSRIAERAALSAEAVQQMSDSDLLDLVFQPGFSTSTSATGLSGRGVGMDVVRRNIEALRGTVTITSDEGAGSIVTLRLPLTLAIIDGFFVEVAGETYVIPLEAVTECQELSREEIRHEDGSGVFNFRGEPLPYLRLRDLFELHDAPPVREHIAIVRVGHRQAGIAVDELLGQDQAVIKPLGKFFRAVPAVAGSTISGNGRVALILDVPALLGLAEARQRALTTAPTSAPTSAPTTVRRPVDATIR